MRMFYALTSSRLPFPGVERHSTHACTGKELVGNSLPSRMGIGPDRRSEFSDWGPSVPGTESHRDSTPRCQAPEAVPQWSSSTPPLPRGGLELRHGPVAFLGATGTEDVPGLEHRGYAPVTYGCPTRFGKPVMFRMARGIPRLTSPCQYCSAPGNRPTSAE